MVFIYLVFQVYVSYIDRVFCGVHEPPVYLYNTAEIHPWRALHS
jgi:hypothetical protein